MQLAAVGPASRGAQAQLIFVLLILAMLPFGVTAIPVPTHGVTFDMGPTAAALPPGAGPEHAGWVRIHDRRAALANRFAIAKVIPLPPPDPTPPRHRLDLLPSGAILLDGERLDQVRLRMRLDVLALGGTGWIDLKPDPHARYEDFAELAATLGRASFDRLRLDNGGFAGAF